jgi:hypothetical protein
VVKEDGDDEVVVVVEDDKYRYDYDEPFIYNNDELYGMEREGSVVVVVDKEDGKKPKEKKKRKLSKKQITPIKHYRVIPIAILPLFLSLMPSYYQNANTLVYECEMVEMRMRNEPNLVNNAKYVVAQIDTLRANRRYISFAHQCSFINASEDKLSDYERELYENEILQLKMEYVIDRKERKLMGKK